MQKRLIGSGIEISAVGLGCMGLSHAFGTPLEKSDAADKVRRAYEMGYTFFDTAECYTGTNDDGSIAVNEEVVGDGIHTFRDKITLATKCGVQFAVGKMLLDSRPETIRKSIEGSLRRLRTDYVDLYYQHRIDPQVEPEVVAETMGQLFREGKIRSWGISCANEDYLRRAHAVCPVTAVQNIYSMIDRDTEKLFDTFEELNIALVAYTPLAKGFLSGKYTERPQFDHPEDNRSGRYQFSAEGFAEYQAVIDLIRATAEQKNATPAQISLAWMLNKKPWIIPIPGTRSVERMQENLNASDINLSAEELHSLDDALNRLDLVDTALARSRKWEGKKEIVQIK